MLEKDHYRKQSVSEQYDIVDLVINAEVLEGCKQACKGCFIDTINADSQWEKVLENSYALAKYYVEKGVRFREMTLNATDFFTAENTLAILKHPTLHKILMLKGEGDLRGVGNGVGDQKLGITTAANFENINLDHVKKIFDYLDTEVFREKMTMEFQIPLNVKKIIEEDPKYLEDNLKAIEFFKNNTKKHVIFSYAFNVFDNNLLKEEGVYEKCTDYVYKHFGTIVENNPGFFRVGNQRVIGSIIKSWRDIVSDSLTRENFKDLHMTGADEHHNSFNTIDVHLHKDDVYVAPFVYQNIYLKADSLKVNNAIQNPENVTKKYMDLVSSAMVYASKVDACSNCTLQAACVGRHVQNVMEHFGITECVFPEKFVNYFHNLSEDKKEESEKEVLAG